MIIRDKLPIRMKLGRRCWTRNFFYRHCEPLKTVFYRDEKNNNNNTPDPNPNANLSLTILKTRDFCFFFPQQNVLSCNVYAQLPQ